MHARVVLGVGKGVLFREVSSVQSVLIERERERERFHCIYFMYFFLTHTHTHTAM